MKRSFADILQDLDGERARKLARKLPEWAAAGAEIPSALSLEQCSSSATARYKAALISSPEPAATASENRSHPRLRKREGPADEVSGRGPKDVFGGSSPPGGARILDLTGGLGVDSWAFSQVAGQVVYFERDAALCAAAERNFARLGAGNISVRNETVTPETKLPEADLIYADPARRSATGRKVFLLEDCTPDILTLLPMLLGKAPAILLKLSPMADLSMLRERLGAVLREIHVVEMDGEVKELLCLLGRTPSPEEPEIAVTRLPGATFRFRMTEEKAAEPVFAAGVQPGELLLEPCPALLKAGAFNLPCKRWGLLKLAPSTHLYLAPVPASPWFKAWRIIEVLPFGAAAFKTVRQRWPRAEVTARNLPLGSAELQKKMGVAPGGDTHIFACRLADGSAALIITER